MTVAFDPTSLIIAAAALAVGLALLIVGLCGRRIGAEPRCRKCGYNLSGAASDHCSECGTVINDYNVETGTRRRRPAAIALGLLLVALAATFGGLDGYKRLQAIDKYRYYPFSWLIDGGHAGDLAALKELDRRLRADKLSSDQTQTLIADALAEQAIVPSTAPAVTQAWVNMLELLCQANKLSDAQQRQYLGQFYTYELVVRPQVRAGEPVPYAIRTTGAGPNWEVDLPDKDRPITTEIWDLVILRLGEGDSQPIHPYRRRSLGPSGSTGVHSVHSRYRPYRTPRMDLTPGRYELSFDLKEVIYDYMIAADINEDYENPLYSQTVSHSATFEVIAADSPDSITLIHDPSLGEQIQAALAFEPLHYHHGPGYVSVSMNMASWAPPSTPPVDAAFDVFVRVEDKEWRLCGITMRAGPVSIYSFGGSAPLDDVATVDVILRSSPDVARNTVDMYEIWDGELVFENVPVKVIQK